MAEKELLYDARIAGGMKQICEIINDVFNEFNSVSWTSNRIEEYGFYLRMKEIKIEMFCGIWFDAWHHFEIPICVTVLYTGNAPVQRHEKIIKWVASEKIDGIDCKHYENHSMILFKHAFFDFETDAARIAHIFHSLRNYLKTL